MRNEEGIRTGDGNTTREKQGMVSGFYMCVSANEMLGKTRKRKDDDWNHFFELGKVLRNTRRREEKKSEEINANAITNWFQMESQLQIEIKFKLDRNKIIRMIMIMMLVVI